MKAILPPALRDGELDLVEVLDLFVADFCHHVVDGEALAAPCCRRLDPPPEVRERSLGDAAITLR
jgi:hypothetical protein